MTVAVVATAFGGPEVLSLVDVEVPAPGIGEVTVRVRTAGVNPADAKSVSGAFGSNPARLPLRVGNEVAGVVTAVGDDSVFEVGDEVVAYRAPGGWAEEITLPAADVFAKPAGLDWSVAGGIMLVGATAWHLVEATSVAAGDTVLVHGASGSVGILAAQLARMRGATVVGTASAANGTLLREHGIEPLEYGAGLLDRVRALGRPIDVALDTVGTDEAVDVSLAVAAPERIATIAAFHRADAGIRVLGSGGDPGTDVRRAVRPRLLDWAADGSLRLPLGPSFPLTAAADAMRLVAGGHPGGKVVLRP